MTDPISTGVSTAAVVQHGFLAFFGALAHAIRAHRNGESKGLLDFFLLTIMSSFSGIVFSLVALYYFPNSHYLTLAAAGSGGFLGVEGLTLLATKIRDLLGNRVQ